jgi:hypothetical protein
MKTKLSFLIIVILFTTTNYAQKIVALHSPTNGVQYFNDDYSFQTAYTAAVAGDTIYLPGGTNIPPAKFEKQLTIFGAGYHPDATTATYPTKISGNVTLSEEADGFYLEGVEITGYIAYDTNESVNDVTIKRCKSYYGLSFAGDRTNPSENNNFIENILPYLSVDNLMNSMFLNNILSRTGYLRNLVFLNNIFLYTGSSNSYEVIYYANNCMFKNNIFTQENGNICEGLGTSTWANNIFCHPNNALASPTGLGTDPTIGEDGNYYVVRADLFVNQTGNAFSYDDDYHLQTAAATNLGDDGTETGIYGGFYPWKDYSIPINPHISSKSISPTTDINGLIQVNINVHAQDQ